MNRTARRPVTVVGLSAFQTVWTARAWRMHRRPVPLAARGFAIPGHPRQAANRNSRGGVWTSFPTVR
ncbi:hypothetical protein BPORC_1859 [Bifidobacterium porcinum]|nr:hypothetical protein BPORC_1859 [Bifidobacterium porcinum]